MTRSNQMTDTAIDFKRRLKQFALAGCVMSGLAGPMQHAQAQVIIRGPAIDEYQLLRQLQRQGFRPVSAPLLNRDVYVLDAIAPGGEPVRLIVSAYNGRIVDSHRQRRTWTRVDPDDEDEWAEPLWRNRQRYDWREDRRGREWSSREDEDDLRHRYGEREFDRERQIAPTLPETNEGRRPAERQPERFTTVPPPVVSTPRDPDLPVPTLKNPTVVKRSPTAIPKQEDEKRERAATKPPVVSTAPPPGAGTKDRPRVIDLSPKPPAAAAPASKSPAVQPKDTARALPTAPPSVIDIPRPRTSGTQMPPPAVLDSPPRLPQPDTPQIPPAIME